MSRRADLLGRTRVAAMLLSVFIAGAIGGSLIASRSSMSPDEATANAAPPPVGPTSARVENRVLAESLSVRGAIVAPNAVDVLATSVSESPNLVLTSMHVLPGDVVESPAVIAEISGRPLIAVAADLPFYRDLYFEDEGDDVLALQRTLGVGESGQFNEETQRGLRVLYEAVGFSVPINTVSADTDAAAVKAASLQSLLDALDDARIAGDEAIRDASLMLDAAEAGYATGNVSGVEVEQAYVALESTVDGRDRAVERAHREVERERERLARVSLVEGPYFARSEVTAVPGGILTAVQVPHSVGTVLEEGSVVATLGEAELTGVVYVSSIEAQMLVAGMPASITGSSLTEPMEGTVGEVSQAPETGGALESEQAEPIGSVATADRPFRVSLKLSSQPPTRTVGLGVLVTITLESTEGDVVDVPVVALQHIGGKEVVVTLPDRRQWVVEVGLAAEGWAELRSGGPPVDARVETR